MYDLFEGTVGTDSNQVFLPESKFDSIYLPECKNTKYTLHDIKNCCYTLILFNIFGLFVANVFLLSTEIEETLTFSVVETFTRRETCQIAYMCL